MIESLERRVFLSVASAASSTNIRDVSNGPMAKSGHNLIDLYLQYRTAQRDGTLNSFLSDSSEIGQNDALSVHGAAVGIEVRTDGDVESLRTSLADLGMVVTSVSTTEKVIAGDFPITLLRQLAQRAGVLDVRPLSPLILRSVGVATDQADTAMKAINARADDGLSGKGVTVGVISDSVNQVGNGLADSVASGDLPSTVTVLQDGSGFGDTDEGRAMLEEIHDLAPNAGLDFASADGGQAAFVAAVQRLEAAGCNVIVDDVGFIDEPAFQPGIIDQAINNAVLSGVTFVTAAGNNGDSGFLQAASFVPQAGSTNQLINFDANGVAATRMTVNITKGGTLTLQWDDPYNGVTGSPAANLDIYFFSANGSTLVASSTDNNFVTGVPLETLNINPGTYQVEIAAVNTPISSLPRYYEFSGDFTLTSTQFPGIRSSIVGHTGNANAITVGAVPFYNSPPVKTTGPIDTESFTSTGPVIQTRDALGHLLPTAVTVQKPDISGTDANNTSFFGSRIAQDPTTRPNFVGTSAAAGNVAGVVALLLQAEPNATPADILSALKASAAPVNGQSAGSYNSAGGFGLVDAVGAVSKLVSDASLPSATIDPVTPDPTLVPVPSITVVFNQPVTGVKISDFDLSFDGGSNILGKTPTLSTVDDQTFVLSGLTVLTAFPGTYTITLMAKGSGIIGEFGQPLAVDASTTFQKTGEIGLPNQPTRLTATAISQGSVRLFWKDNSTNEDFYVVQRSTNPLFKVNVKSFDLLVNSTAFTDGGLQAATRYYYRVFAENSNGDGPFSGTATAATYSRGEVILDNTSKTGVTIRGDWTASTDVPGFYGSNYLQDDNTGKGQKSVTFTPALLKGGNYFVYAQWSRAADRAKSVPFDIFSQRGVLLDTVFVNERKSGGFGWTLLGKFALHTGGAAVRIRNNGTKGEVIADAVRFLPANAIGGTTAVTPSEVRADVIRASTAAPAVNVDPLNPFGFGNSQIEDSD